MVALCQSKSYIAQRAEKALQIDGRLADECWQHVNWTGDFVQYEPIPGAAPSQQTQYAIVYDDNNLYVAIKAFDAEPDKIVRRISRRDDIDGDWVSVIIDSYEDKMTAFEFTVSASGSKGDLLRSESGGEDET